MSAPFLHPFLPDQINTGPWVGGYSLDELRRRIPKHRVVLPIGSLGTPAADFARLGPLVLPPLYRDAWTDDPALEAELVAQIGRCFPYFTGTRARAEYRGAIEVVQVPAVSARRPAPPRVLAVGVDTTVEQHGPHLPLATDTIQTYGVLHRLAAELEGVVAGPALEYGHLTWGLPFGMSVDLTPPLLARYAAGFLRALVDWYRPAALYVADVHGSIVHRNTIEAVLAESGAARTRFRWLPDPIVGFSADRGDMHAGGVETALVSRIHPDWVEVAKWPARFDELAAGEMPVAEALALSTDLSRFIERVEAGGVNGIIGRIRNPVDGAAMFDAMLDVARADVQALLD